MNVANYGSDWSLACKVALGCTIRNGRCEAAAVAEESGISGVAIAGIVIGVVGMCIPKAHVWGCVWCVVTLPLLPQTPFCTPFVWLDAPSCFLLVFVIVVVAVLAMVYFWMMRRGARKKKTRDRTS